MAVWANLSIAALVVVFALVVAYTAVATRGNNAEKSNNVLLPFSAAVADLGRPLLEKARANQIQCPAGSKINVVAAYFDVYDPYTQCSEDPDEALQKQCEASPDDDVCANTYAAAGKFGINTVCSPGGEGDCRMRDATAFLGAQCNGKSSCDVVVDNTFFGPDPCKALANFDLLPGIPGEGTEIKQGYYVHGVFACVLD